MAPLVGTGLSSQFSKCCSGCTDPRLVVYQVKPAEFTKGGPKKFVVITYRFILFKISAWETQLLQKIMLKVLTGWELKDKLSYI